MSRWPLVKLGEVLRRVERFEPRNELKEYPFAGTYSFARGIFVGERKFGSAFALPKIQRIHSGDFIYCKIMAWEGAFGIAPKEVHNHVMSNAFVVYELNHDKLDAKFIDYFFKVPAHWKAIGSQSSGTNVRRQSLHPNQFEESTIPLPPLAEQRRIVTRIEELAAQINEAKELRRETAEDTDLIFNARASVFFNINDTKKSTLLEAIAILERGKFNHRPRNEPRFFGGNYPWIQIGEIENSKKYIKTWSQTLNDEGLAISKKFPRGTVLISIAATIGAVGILDFDCCIPDSIVGVTPKQQTSSEFLYYYLRYLRSHLEDIAPQCAQKNINLAILAKIPFPIYSLSEQNGIVGELNTLQEEIDRLSHLHAETAAELNVLLPAVLDRAFKGEL